MPPHVNAIIASVDLILPPIANSKATQASSNPNVVSLMRTSDFYMIGARAQATFFDTDIDEDSYHVTFGIRVQGGAEGRGYIDIERLPPRVSLGDIPLVIKFSDSLIAFFKHEDSGDHVLIASFTPEDILWRRGRKEEFVGGLSNHLELASYDLLYVGKATGTDSFHRLLKKGHEARQKILSDEPQRFPGARVSDEIYLFLFQVEPLLLRSWRPEDDIEEGDLKLTYSNERLVSDAEKAFISLLKPKYNNQLYQSYPKGDGGIYHDGYTGYSYSLSDGLVFRTAYGSMKGAREAELTLSNDADFISVKGESVKLHIAGADYDVDAPPHSLD
ncbi:hypothetical protein [Stenotrophomonas maltophilia]